MNDHAPTSMTPAQAAPPDASGAGPDTSGSWRRRTRRSAILGVLIAISLLANRSATVWAFGDLRVDIGGVSPQIPNSCLSCAAVPPTVPDPFHPDDTVIAGAQTLPSLIIPANRSFDQDPEDAFIVTVRNGDVNPANPSSEPVVFEYRAPEGVVITGMQMNGVNSSGPVINLPCEIGTELDPPEPATCELGQLPPVVGAITIQIEYYVDRKVERLTLLDHDVRAYLTPIGTDANEADNQDHAFTTVETLADLDVFKSGPSCPFPFFPNNMKAGTCDIFRLAVHNHGPSVSRNVFLGDNFLLNMRQGLTFESATVVDTENTQGTVCSVQTTFGVNKSILCDLGDINVGDVRNVDVKICADSNIPDGMNFLNFAAVGSGSLPPPLGINPLIPAGIIPILGVEYPFTPEPCLSLTGALKCLNNVSVLPIVVNSEGDLDIEKSSEPDKVNAGEQKKYTIKVTNNGPSDVLNPIVKDTLPPGTDYEIDDDNCIVRDRNASGPDKYGYFTEDSGSDPFMGRDGPQDGHDIDNGEPPPLPLPYNVADPGDPFFDISTTGTVVAGFAPNADDGSASVPIGFPFDFYDDFAQTSVWVSTNGYLKFGTGGPDTTDPLNDCPLTESTPNRAIYAFWDDLDVTGGSVRTRVVTNPEDGTQSVFIVQWTDVTVKSSGEQISFQIQLYENTNVVRIVYGPGVGASPATSGQSATAGIEPRSELAEEGGGVTFGCGDDANPATPFLDENLVVQFTPGGLQGNPPGPQDELICHIGEQVKDGAVPAYVDGAFTGFPNLGCIAGLLDLSLPFDDFNITNDKIFEFPDGSTVTHVMKPGEMRVIELQALVDPSTKPGTIITNTAVVTGYTTLGDPTTMQMPDNFQPFGGNNTATTKNLVLEQADLRVQKFGKPDRQLKAGEILTYTIIVDNYGPSWATNTAVKDLIQSSGTFDLIDINSDRRAVCRGLPGPDEVTLNPREWPLKDPPPPFGVNGSSGEDDIPQRLELDCNLDDDPDSPEGDEMYAENTMENRLEVLKADGPPNSGRWILTLRVRAREAQSINNTVTALSDASDPDMANNTTTVEHDILASADLEISKTDSGDPFVAGTEFEYYIDVTNHGPSTAMNVVVVDDLPLEVSLVEMSQPGPGSCGTVQGTIGNVRVTCNLGAVGVDSTRRITLRVKVDPDVVDGTYLWNLAYVSSDAMDMNNRNNITRSRSLIIARADIGVTKIDEPDPVIAGETLQYTITAVNHGPSNSRDVVVRDDLPRHVTFVSAEVVEGSGTCLPLPAGAVTCQLGKMTVGEVNTIVLTVKVDENDTPCDIELTNDVEIVSTTEDPDPDPTPNNDRRMTHVDCRATLAVKKTVSDLTPVAGTDLRYTISVTNNGPSVAENVFVIDTLPAEQTYRLDDFGCGNSLFGSGCNIGDLAVGQTVTFDVVVAIDSDATCGAKFTNRVSADSDNSDRVEATADVVIDCESDLWIRKFGKPDDAVQAGEELTYYVTVTNLGPSDTVPDEVFFRDLLASSGKFTLTRLTSSHDASCDTDNHAPFTPPYNGAIQGDKDMELSCTLKSDLNPNEQWMVEIDVTATQAQTLNNTADVYHAKSKDPNTANNHAEVEHAITDVADLSIEKSDSGDPFLAGTTFSYDLTIVNDGPSPAENVVVVDTLPLGLKVTGINQPGTGSCALVQATPGNPEVTCYLGDLASGDASSARIDVAVDPSMPSGSLLWNEAVVYSDVFDPNTSDNIARARSRIATEADLEVEKVDEPDPVVAGETLTYQINVRNHGPSDARAVVLTDTLPEGLTVIEVSSVDGSAICRPLPPGSITCDIGTLPAGAGEAIVIVTRVDPGLSCGTDLLNVASATSATDEPNPDPSPNADTRMTDVDCLARLKVTKTPSTYAPVAGEDLVYTISVTNLGPSVAEAVTVKDILPSGMSYLFDTQGCGVDLVGGGCEIADLQPGQTVSFDVVVAVSALAPCRTVLTNTAIVTSPSAASVVAKSDVVVNCVSDLRVLKFGKPDGSVRAGDILTYTVIVDNLGPSVARGVFLKDVIQASGSFDLLGIESDRDAACTTEPTSWDKISQRAEIDCTLSDPLEVVEASGNFPNPGRWMVTMSVRAREAQSINNVADAGAVLARDPNPANNRAVVEHAITDVADLSISKTDSGDPFKAGTTFEYLITVDNNGPSSAENVVVDDTLPLGLTVVGISQPGVGSCTTVQQTTGNTQVRCALGTLIDEESRTITIEVRSDPAMTDGAILWNEARVTSDVFDPSNRNNISRARSEIVAEADLKLTKVDEPDPVVAGQALEYRLLIENMGPSFARDVVVSDDMPTGVEVVGVSTQSGRGVCRPLPAGFVTCQFDQLAPGASESIVISARVLPDLPCGSPLVNTASAQSSTAEPNPDPSPNTASASTAVECLARLSATKTASTYAPAAGSDLVYTLSVTNHGPSVAEAVTVVDLLPAGMSYLFDTRACGAGLFGAGCELGDMAPSETIRFDIAVALAPNAACRSVLTNTATFTSPTAATVVVTSDVVVDCTSDLRVLKFGKPDAGVRAGEVLTYTVIVDNLGPSAAQGVFIKDVIQASGTFSIVGIQSDRDAVCTTEPPVWTDIVQHAEIDCNLNDPLEVVQASGNFPNPGRWIVTVSVRAREAQSINNVADAGAVLARDPNPANNRGVVEHAITDVADLSISKTDSGDPFKAGTSFDYLISVLNEGPSTADNVVVWDTLPLGLTLVGMSQPGTGSCGTVQATGDNTQVRCNLGSLASGATSEITIEVRAAADLADGSILWNEALVTSDVFDPDNSDNISRARSVIVAEADLGITKTDTPDPVVAGQTIEYRLAVRNNGPSDALGVVVTDDLPEGVQVTGLATLSGRGSCQPLPAGFVTCALGTLAAGASDEIVITVKVDPAAPCGAGLANQALITSRTDEPDPDPSPNSAAATTAVDCRARLRATKTASTYAPVAGGDLVYTLTVTNDGPSVAEAVTVVDVLPAGVSYLFDTRGCGPDLAGTGCELADIAPGASISFDIAVAVAPSAPCRTVLTNTATFTSITAESVVARADVVVNCVSDLRVLKFGKPDDTVRAGEVLTYTIVVDNLGPSVAREVYVKDLVRASGRFTLLGVQSDRDAVCTTEPPVWTGIPEQLEIDCELTDPLDVLHGDGSFPNPGRWNITVQLRADEAQSVNNVADAGAAMSTDPNPFNNRGVVEHAITDVADLAITKADSGGPFTAGEEFTYTLGVTNQGPSTADNVQVIDNLPLGLSVVDITAPAGTACTVVQQVPGNPQVLCNLGHLASGAQASISIQVRADPGLGHGTLLSNQALVQSQVFDPNNRNNVARVQSRIVGVADLGLTKSAGPNPVTAGENLDYVLTVTNHGSSTAHDVVVTDQLPAGVAVVSMGVLNAPGFCQALPPGSVTCQLGTLEPGAVRAVSVSVRVDPNLQCGSNLVNQAAVTSTTAEPVPDPSPNSAGTTTGVGCRPRLRVNKTVSEFLPVAGRNLTYTIRVQNDGPSTATDVVLVDDLPDGVSYRLDSRGCGLGLFGAGCPLGDLAPGAVVSLDVVVYVHPDAPCGTTLTNRATASAPNAAPASATADVQIECANDLRVLKLAKPDGAVQAGGVLTYTVIIDNLGPSHAPGVALKDVLRSSGSFDLIDIVSDRDMDGCLTEPGATGGGGTLDDPLVKGVRNSLDIDCTLSDPLGVLAADGFPNPGRWTLTMRVRATEAQSLNNAADAVSVNDPDYGNNRAVVEREIIDVADLSVMKTDLPDCAPGDDWPGNFCDMQGNGDTVVPAGSRDDPDDPAGESSFHYRLTVHNAGPSAADNVVVTDSLPKEIRVTRIRKDPDQGACSTVQGALGQPVVTCNLGRVANGATVKVDIFVHVPADVADGTILWNEVSVGSGGIDPDNGNNISRSRTDVIGVADLSIKKNDSPDPATAGDKMVYTIDVENHGPSVARGVAMEDALPAGLSATSVDVVGVTDEKCSVNPLSTDSGRDLVTCEIGDVAVGRKVQILILADIAEDIVGAGESGQCIKLDNSVKVTAVTKDPDTDDNNAGSRTDICAQADLKLTKTSAPEKVNAGEQKRYTLTVENLGPSAASGVTVYDVLPDAVAYEVDTNAAMCTRPSNLVGFRAALNTASEIPNPSGPDSATGLATFVYDTNAQVLEYSVFVNDMTSAITGAHIHQAAAGVAGPVVLDLFTSPTVVDATHPLVVKRTLTAPEIAVLGDVLANPAGFYVNVHTSQNPSGEIRGQMARTANSPLRCEIGALAAGASHSFDIFVKINPDTSASTSIVNTALAFADAPPDKNLSNNAAQAKNLVLTKSDLRVVKFGKRDASVRAGDILTYTIIVDNLGPSAVEGVALKDVLRASGTFDVVNLDSDRDMTCTSNPNPISGGGTPGDPLIPNNANDVEIDCTLDTPLGVLNVGDFPNPGRWIVTLRVQADETQSINNVADVLSGAVDPNAGNNHAEVEHDITDVADLAVIKTGPMMVVAGDPIGYTVVVTNRGPSTAENVVVYDRLPPGIVVSNSTVVNGQGQPAGSCTTGAPGDAADKLTCGLGTLGVGQQRTVTILATVDAGLPAGTTLENDAFALSDVFDDDNSNNFAHVLTTVKSRADLAVTKTSSRDDDGDVTDDGEDDAVAGQPIEYTVKVRNNGVSDAANVQVVDTLPAGTTFLGAEITVGSGVCVGLPTGQVKCQLGVLAAGAMVEIVIRARVEAGVDCDDQPFLVNQVEVTSPSETDPASLADNSYTLTTPLDCRADLVIEKWSDPVKVNAGEQKKYTVRTTNLGPSDAVGIVVIDTLPPEVDYEINTGGCAVALGATPGDSDVVTCDVGTLPPGGVFQFDIYAKVKPYVASGTEITNTATVASGTDDPNLANNTATSKNLVLQKADLYVRKFGKPDGAVRAGDVLTYTVIIDNLGPSYADGVALKDILQSSATFDLVDIISDRAASCRILPQGTTPIDTLLDATAWPPVEPPAAFGVDPASGVAGIRNRLEVDCTLADPFAVLKADGPPNSGRWIITMRIRAAQTQDVNNVAETLSEAADPNPANNSAFVEHDITDLADLSITKSDSPDPVVAGQTLTYVITVTNNGPSDAENVQVLDRLPPGIVVKSATATGGGSCTTGAAGNPLDKLACSLGTIPPGQFRTVTVVTTVLPGVREGTVLENDAQVFSEVFDDNNSNNFAHTLTTVGTVADLDVQKVGDPDGVKAGEVTTFDIFFRNNGPSVARDVILIDELPAELDLLRAYVVDGSPVSDSATCFQRTEDADPVMRDTLTCELGDIAPGQSGQVVVVALVRSDAPAGIVTNNVAISSDTPEPDPDSGPNFSSYDLEILPMADLWVQKWSDPIIVNAGERKRYTVKVTNLGPSDAVDVTMTDTLPTAVDYEIDNGLCDESLNTGPGGADVVTCHFGTLKPGESRLVDIYTTVRPNTAPDALLTNRAVVTSATPDGINEANNTATSENRVKQKADLKVTKFGKNDGKVRAAEILTYTVIVDNLGPSWANAVAIKDVLQTAGKFDLIDITSDRAASCKILPLGLTPINAAVPATAWPITTPPPANLGQVNPPTGVANVDQRVEVDCTLAAPLEVLAADGPPNSGRWIVTMRVRARQAQSVNNVVTVTSAIAADPDPSNNMAIVEHEITDVADLTVVKTAIGEVVTGCLNNNSVITPQADMVTAGLKLTYKLVVTNNGPSDAENVVVYDRLPSGVVVIGGTVDDKKGGGPSAAKFATWCATGAPGSAADKLTCGLGTLGPVPSASKPNTMTIEFTVRVDPGLSTGTTLENDAHVASDMFDPVNRNWTNNLTTVKTSADLELSKSHDPATVTAGDLLRYTLKVTNAGPSVARDVTLYDELPAQVSFLSAVGASCTEDPVSPGDLTCRIGDMAPGEVRYVYLIVRVAPDAPTSIVNNASVQSGFSDDTPVPAGTITPDPCPADNVATDTTLVIRKADVVVTKVDLSDPVIAGKTASYLITFRNLGPSTATGVSVKDTLPAGFTFNRCESIDPNDKVTCTAAGQVVTLISILEANTTVFQNLGPLDPGRSFSFVLVADVSPGYVLDGLTSGGAGGVCQSYAAASGYLFWAADRVEITATEDANQGAPIGRNNFDDECTRVNAEADLSIDKTDIFGSQTQSPGNYFLQCDPVQPGGMITYDLTITNDGMSDAAQVQVMDQLPADFVALAPAQVRVSELVGSVFVEITDATRIEKRDDGKITVIVGNDPRRAAPTTAQRGRLNAGGSTKLRIQVMVANPWGEMSDKRFINPMPPYEDICGAQLVNTAMVQTIKGPTSIWPTTGQTPTRDPNADNNADSETTTIECPAINVEKTVSFDGKCPGRSTRTAVPAGQKPTFCFEITNVGTTYLDSVTITDTLRTSMGNLVIYTETITFGKDRKFPIAPGETVNRQIESPPLTGMCGTVTNSVEVAATPVNSGRTPYPCLAPIRDADAINLDVPCGGADYRLALPALNADTCETWLQIQNVGDHATKAIVVIWGEAGACEPQAAGPLKMECTGLLRPGSAWSFPSDRIPPGSASAIVYSMNASDSILTPQGNPLPFADVACRWLFDIIVGDDSQWIQFDQAYRNGGVFLGPPGSGGTQLTLDFGAHPGEPVAVSVNRTCPDPTDPNRNVSAAYTGISSEREGVYDPVYGGYAYYAPLVFANKGGLSSTIYIQNLSIECSSLELWFKGQDNCMRPILGDVLSVASGESVIFDPNTVVGPDWIGSAWIRSSGPMAIVVDSLGPNHFTSYTGVPSDSDDAGFTLGSLVNYAPLIYSEYQGWDAAIQVQNLSGTTAAKVKVYFLDRSGDVITTVVDWICPRGSQTFFLPVIAGIPGSWVGSARVESQEWWTPGTKPVDPPRVQSVVLLEKWSDPARSERREAVAYNALTEQLSYTWQVGKLDGGTQSGSAVIAVPILAKGNRNINSELAITNLVAKPGFTDFAIYLYDQNGLLDHVCQKLHSRQVEYIDLAVWGYVPQRFLGSAVISATFWEHEVFSPTGNFTRNLVGLGAVIVERIGGTLGGPDVPGDESKAFEGIPIFDQFHNEKAPDCGPTPR